MKETSWSDIGAQFLRLRKLAAKTQAEVASIVGFDASKVSRIEDGKVTLNDEEVRSLLGALGTTEARRYHEYLQLSWDFVVRPAFDHPDLHVLSTTERTLQRITAFTNANASPALLAQARMHIIALNRAAAFLADRDHALAFLGPIGVGKTTGLCTLCGISMDGKDDPIDRILLEYGGGGTTICEVIITTGQGYQVGIEPYNDEEVIHFVNEFCAGFQEEQNTTENERGVAKEIDRALRNMTGLKIDRTRGPDGKRQNKDRAAELAKTLSPEALRSEVFTLLRTWERTTTTITHDPATDSDGKSWLRQTFAAINKGQRPDVGLPRRITVTVPFSLLPAATSNITVVDTKGIDGSPLRPDLTACIENPRMITVLCSTFNDAPGPIFEQLLKQVIDTGATDTVFPRIAVLALARSGEAKKMRDDGEFVQTEEDGYDLKIEQAQAELRRWGGNGIPVRVYNANIDNPAPILEFLNGKIMSMRAEHAARINHISVEIDRLITDHESVLLAAAQRDVFRRLAIFMQQHQQLPERTSPVHQRLDRALREQHQRSVWATTNRSGSWPNLDVYYYLGVGNAIDAKRRADPAIAGLRELINNMLGDPTLAPAHGFLRELANNMSTWRDEFIEAVTRIGQTTFRPALKGADQLWNQCAELYGCGSGYRDDVANLVTAWFNDAAQAELHQLVEQHVNQAWSTAIMQRLQALCQPPAAEAATRPTS